MCLNCPNSFLIQEIVWQKRVSVGGGGGHVFRFGGPWLQIRNINILIYKNAPYRLQVWTNFHEIHMVGAGPLMGEPYCFWKQSAQ